MTYKLSATLLTGTLLTLAACSPGSDPEKPKIATPPMQQEQTPKSQNDTLITGFQNPPSEARPRVWWHWMNGNITQDGIAKDLAWMARIGIGGVQNFDANLQTPKIVDERLVYMTPPWQDAFRFAATEADRLGLELAIASSPGWSETGGPWVPPKDGLKKLVWSETLIPSGQPFNARLPAPPSTTGPFQSLSVNDPMAAAAGEGTQPKPQYYSDILVLAYPVTTPATLPTPSIQSASGEVTDARALTDLDPQTSVEVARGTIEAPGYIEIIYPHPQTLRSASIFVPEPFAALLGGATISPQLEASDDGANWRSIANIAPGAVPTTVSFAPVTARHWRLLLVPADSTSEREKWGSAPGVDSSDYRGMIRAGLASKPVAVGELRLSPESRIDRFEAKAGFSLVTDYFALSQDVPTATGIDPDTVIDITSHVAADGTLNWTPPEESRQGAEAAPGEGQWKVLRLGFSLVGTTNHPATPEATGLEVDKFDGEAVRRYMEHYLGLYAETLGEPLADQQKLDAILTDSIEVGAANWTPHMVARFQQLRGYDPTSWLPAMTGTIVGSREQSDKFLYDYRRTLADLMVSEHYGTVAEVAHEHGLKVYGEALEDKRPSLGDDMAMRRHTDIPMAAMWTYKREFGPRVTLLADVKGAASVAHIYGQNLVAAESLTSAAFPWAHSPADLKRIIDLEFVLGVNRPVIHTSVHQPVDDKIPGLSLFIFGQYFNRHETWAEMAKPWVDYISRNSFMLQQGRNVADLGYFYGEEAPLTGLFGEVPVADIPKKYAWDFVNVDALMHELDNDGSELVSKGGARYQALYLGGSSNRMTLATLQRIATLAKGGATIIGKPPASSPNLLDDTDEFQTLVSQLWSGDPITTVGAGRVLDSDDTEAALALISIPPDFYYTGGNEDSTIPFVHRQLADGDSYFLVNQQERTETVEAHFRVSGKAPQLWRAETGMTEPLSYRIENGETVIPLTLAADESVHIVFRETATEKQRILESVVTQQIASIETPWLVRFQEGRGAPTQIDMPSLTPLNQMPEDGVRHFSGIATYTTEFTAPDDWQPGSSLWLDLGNVGDLAEVHLNGKNVGTTWHAPYRLDITAAVKAGQNQLEIRVANLWVNRLIGDARPDIDKITWTPLPSYRGDAPLRTSGLIGPVTLLSEGARLE